MDDPLVNDYRPTDYPPRPVTKYQRQLGEIVIAEYPYWCSKCRLFGHKADWCDLWKEKAYLWYYAYVQHHNLPKSEHCTKCLKAGYPDAARNHMTKHCGLLVPYDHPENVSFAKLAVQPSEIEKFARLWASQACYSIYHGNELVRVKHNHGAAGECSNQALHHWCSGASKGLDFEFSWWSHLCGAEYCWIIQSCSTSLVLPGHCQAAVVVSYTPSTGLGELQKPQLR